MELLAGFILGLLGSFHCAAMCGPIALALPRSKSEYDFILGRTLYNTGRVITYSLLGLIFGLFGERIFIGEFQQTVSFYIGVGMLFYLAKPLLLKTKEKRFQIKTDRKTNLFESFKNMFVKILNKNSKSALFSIGLLNGLLPCGFIYLALSAAVIIGSPLKSGMFMASFGIGTIPLMLVVSVSGNLIKSYIKQKIGKLSLIFKLAVALLFIVRGMNLNIPYLSPKIDLKNNGTEQLICH